MIWGSSLDPLIKVIPPGYEHQGMSKMGFINPRFPKQKLWPRGTFYKPFSCKLQNLFIIQKRIEDDENWLSPYMFMFFY